MMPYRLHVWVATIKISGAVYSLKLALLKVGANGRDFEDSANKLRQMGLAIVSLHLTLRRMVPKPISSK